MRSVECDARGDGGDPGACAAAGVGSYPYWLVPASSGTGPPTILTGLQSFEQLEEALAPPTTANTRQQPPPAAAQKPPAAAAKDPLRLTPLLDGAAAQEPPCDDCKVAPK